MTDAAREAEIRQLRKNEAAPRQWHADWSITFEWTMKEIDCLLRLLDETRAEIALADVRAYRDGYVRGIEEVTRWHGAEMDRAADAAELGTAEDNQRAQFHCDSMKAIRALLLTKSE